MIKLPKILPSPQHPSNLAKSAKWLSGEGAGSWFVIERIDESMNLKVSRHSPMGNLECEGTFKADKRVILEDDYSITYPSHCAAVTIIQGGQRINLRITN